MNAKPAVLVVDDDAGVVSSLLDSLKDEGIVATGETSAQAAIERLAREKFDVVVSDVEMPGMRGPELLRAIKERWPHQPVVFITAFGSIDLAMELVRAGAADFLPKPFPVEALVLSIERVVRERQLEREIVRLREASAQQSPPGLIAKSPAMQRVVELCRRAAASSLAMLVTGESGVGKGVLARFIHESGPRAARPMVQLNCAALPASLAEAELFGVRRGAFTDAKEDRKGVFEQAHESTLFLDEIGDLPLELQPKLLSALESSQVRPVGATSGVPADVRVIAATNRPLEEALRERRFREDLYHRLNVIRLEVPPLRERPEDVDALVEQFVQDAARRTGRVTLELSVDARRWLRGQEWPGNVRQLKNAIERAAALSVADTLSLSDFAQPAPGGAAAMVDEAAEAEWSLEQLERAYLRRVLAKTEGNRARAAKILGIDRRTLYRKAAELEGRTDADDEPVDGS